MTAKSKCPPQLIHELSPSGRHRIVEVRDGDNLAGEWAAHDQLAQHPNGALACADPGQPLPQGIFRVRELPYQVLA